MHRALATVDLDRIRHNTGSLISRLNPGCGLMAVVKADGYGHGAVQVARVAQEAGAIALGVATAREAIALREAGVTGTLVVLGPLTQAGLETALAADAQVILWSKSFARELVRLGRQLDRRIGVHIKLDTGMRRLGIYPRHLPVFLDDLQTEPEIDLIGVMTHFATADEEDDFFDFQLRAFEEAIQPVIMRSPQRIVFHCANSAATLMHPQAHFDMVRCGIAIYGMSPFQSNPRKDGLQPALRLSSYVADVKRLTEGDSVGYGRSWIAPRNTSIAMVPVGYGDGFSRRLSNRGRALIGGAAYPIVGRISMDLLTVDLLGSGHGIRHGDEVVLIGAQGDQEILAEEIAAELSTINYEITCNLGARVERRYSG